MAEPNDARGIIYVALNTAWTGATTAPLTLENEKFDPPADAAWGRGVVRHFNREQESLGGIGNRKFESTGQCVVQCFGPLNDGTSPADALAVIVIDALEGKTISGVRFFGATPREIGVTEDWFQINVEADFTYTTTK